MERLLRSELMVRHWGHWSWCCCWSDWWFLCCLIGSFIGTVCNLCNGFANLCSLLLVLPGMFNYGSQTG